MQNSFALQLRDYYFNERFREPLSAVLVSNDQYLSALLVTYWLRFETYLAKLTKDTRRTGNGPIVQIKDICDLYTDMIASIAFGLRSLTTKYVSCPALPI
ncbi:Probable cytochrome P450 6v1 [Eumeta japonica]|uniref:Probable cytochrome P450 6v1 n=1 Tax=Eumeta variegata TaxID=151549 RepID=A0A4C1SF08_EUMVA|nr:Probable cytochrome P450 6v1 [Eumeta japonica]